MKSLLGVKGGKAVKSEPNPATMQHPKSISLEQAPPCKTCPSISLLNIKGGKGKTSALQTTSVQTISTIKSVQIPSTKWGGFEQPNYEAGPCSNGCRRFF